MKKERMFRLTLMLCLMLPFISCNKETDEENERKKELEQIVDDPNDPNYRVPSNETAKDFEQAVDLERDGAVVVDYSLTLVQEYDELGSKERIVQFLVPYWAGWPLDEHMPGIYVNNPDVFSSVRIQGVDMNLPVTLVEENVEDHDVVYDLYCKLYMLKTSVGDIGFRFQYGIPRYYKTPSGTQIPVEGIDVSYPFSDIVFLDPVMTWSEKTAESAMAEISFPITYKVYGIATPQPENILIYLFWPPEE